MVIRCATWDGLDGHGALSRQGRNYARDTLEEAFSIQVGLDSADEAGG